MWPWLCENHPLVLIWRKWVFCWRLTLYPCTIMWQNILWKLSLFAEIWALLWNTTKFNKTHKTSQKSGFVIRLWNGKNSFRKGDSSKWNKYWICCYLPCEQKVNTVLHLHRNWLLRSWTGDITVFRVAVLANLLGEVLSTLVWESSWRNDWRQISGTEGWYVNPWLQDVNHAVPQGWGFRDGDLARWCGWEGELPVLGLLHSLANVL